MTRSQLKEQAKLIMRHSRLNMFLGTLVIPVYLMLTYALTYAEKTLVLNLIIGLLLPTVTYLGVRLIRSGRQEITLKDNIFGESTEASDLLDILVLNLLVGLFTLLWSFLFIIPGIIKAYSYSQAINVFFDHKKNGTKISYTQAIKESTLMMKGNKFDLFILQLSFIGWWIPVSIVLSSTMYSFSSGSVVNGLLSGVIGGILFWVLTIYSQLTHGAFYVDIKDNSYN